MLVVVDGVPHHHHGVVLRVVLESLGLVVANSVCEDGTVLNLVEVMLSPTLGYLFRRCLTSVS